MANYITTFDTHAEYNSATTLNYPNVSVINEDMSVIYAKEAPEPTFDGKYKFTLAEGNVVSAECDSSTSITTTDTRYYTTSVTDAIIGDCVMKIGDKAFSGCTNLSSVTIPDSVRNIAQNAFINCSSLTSVTIPSGVTSIGRSAFGSCSGLTSIIINATTPPTLGSRAFDNTNDCPIYVPSESVEDYKFVWSPYEGRIQAIS